MRRVLITGGAGLAGQALLRRVPEGVEAVATWRSTPLQVGSGPQVDLCDADAVATVFGDTEPDLVIHTAYTQSSRADIVDATTNVARAAGHAGARMVHISSDCVFGGECAPYLEIGLPDRSEPAGGRQGVAAVDPPADDYGRWKAEVEAIVTGLVPDAAVVRTSLLVDLVNLDPRTATIIDGLRTGEAVKLFVDEVRSPVSVDDFADGLWRLVELDRAAAAGVWHLAGTEALSRYSLGVLAASAWGLDPAGITPTRQQDHPHPRARDIRLDISRAQKQLGFLPRTMAEVFSASGTAS